MGLRRRPILVTGETRARKRRDLPVRRDAADTVIQGVGDEDAAAPIHGDRLWGRKLGRRADPIGKSRKPAPGEGRGHAIRGNPSNPLVEGVGYVQRSARIERHPAGSVELGGKARPVSEARTGGPYPGRDDAAGRNGPDAVVEAIRDESLATRADHEGHWTVEASRRPQTVLVPSRVATRQSFQSKASRQERRTASGGCGGRADLRAHGLRAGRCQQERRGREPEPDGVPRIRAAGQAVKPRCATT